LAKRKKLALVNHPTAKEVHARLIAWRTDVNALMPTKNAGDAARPTTTNLKTKMKKKTE